MLRSRWCLAVLLVTIPACGKRAAEPTAWTTFPTNRVLPWPGTPDAPEPVATDIVPAPREVKRQEPLDGTLVTDGRKLFLKMQCVNCHTGSASARAPALERLYGSKVALKGDAVTTADEAYLVESVREPKAKVVEGWEAIMPAYDEKQLDAQELKAVIEYIKSLRGGAPKPKDDVFPSPVGAPKEK